MPDETQRLIVSVETDRQKAQETAAALGKHQDSVRSLLRSYRDLELEGRKLREVGAIAAASGVAILAPLIASANEYAKRYGALEAQSRAFIAAQQRQTDATAAIGRVAAQALTPVMNQTAAFMEKVAAFASAHPELISAAVGVGGALVAGGGALVAAGTAITTIARSAELLKAALGVIGGGGLATAAAQAAIGVVALGAGAVAGVALVNKLGEAYHNEQLAHYQLADTLKTVRQVLAGATLAIATEFVEAKKTLSELAAIITDVGALVKSKFESILDRVATGFRIFLLSIQKLATDFYNSIASSPLGQQLKMAPVAVSLENSPAAAISKEQSDLADRERNRADILRAGGSGQGSAINQQYEADRANLKKLADAAANFANSGSLGPTIDRIAQGIKDAVASAVSGKPGGITTGTTGLPPEAVNAYIELRKAQTASDKQYAIEQKTLQRDFQQTEAKARREHADEMLRIQQEEQQAESDLATKYSNETAKIASDRAAAEAKAQSDFNFSEAETQKRADFERLQRLKQHQFQLNDLVASRDVAGFISTNKQFLFEERQRKAQENFDAQQRKEQFDQQNKDRAAQYAQEDKDRAIQYQQELVALQKQAEIKRQQAEQHFANEERDRRTAYEQQLDALRIKHNQEKQLLLQHFAEQLAALQENVAGLKAIHDAYYAQATADAQNFVSSNLAILQQLYGASIGGGVTYNPSTMPSDGGGLIAPSASSGQALTQDALDQIVQQSGFLLPSFDVGGRVPHDMIARVHRGEIISNPARGQGGAHVTVNVVNPIGADNIVDAATRGALRGVNQAHQLAMGGAG